MVKKMLFNLSENFFKTLFSKYLDVSYKKDLYTYIVLIFAMGGKNEKKPFERILCYYGFSYDFINPYNT
jgi:hypothetical protein